MSYKSTDNNPVGAIIVYPSINIPEDYLECNGAEINREAYSELFEVIGESYGAGDGETTFKLPDLRGEFVRGLDNGREVDSGRVLGSGQKGTLVDYDGVVLPGNVLRQLSTIAAQGQGTPNFDYITAKKNLGFDTVDPNEYAETGMTIQSTADANTMFISVASASTAIGATRPRNVAMIYCIKAKLDLSFEETVKKRLELLEKGNNPPGTIIYTSSPISPEGYFKADGAEVNRIDYAALFAVIGTTFGAGDGSTTFKLPDLRGEFIRGWSDRSSIDSGRMFGSKQGDAIRNFTGKVYTSPLAGGASFGMTGGEGVFYSSPSTTVQAATNGGAGTGSMFAILDASRQVPTAPENRPRNIALLACIKY